MNGHGCLKGNTHSSPIVDLTATKHGQFCVMVTIFDVKNKKRHEIYFVDEERVDRIVVEDEGVAGCFLRSIMKREMTGA